MSKTTTTDFQAIYNKAHEEGMNAGLNKTPRPMGVIAGSGDSVVIDVIEEGLCGFGWIEFAGNTAWGKWAKANKIADKHYPKGLYIWVGEFGQSYERKKAYAKAFAKVLNDNGIDAYGTGRLD